LPTQVINPKKSQTSCELRTSWKLTSSQPGFPTSFQLVRLCGLRP